MLVAMVACLRALPLMLAAALLPACLCVDPSLLEQFPCAEGSICPEGFFCCNGTCGREQCPPSVDGGTLDAGTLCGPSNCSGCCEGTVCVSGTDASACGNRHPNSAPCTQASECQSQLCVDEVCCEAACEGACESCALPGSEGRCVPLLEGAAGSPSCSPRACDGLSGACPSTCTSLRQCAPGHYCDPSGACVIQKPNGQPCVAGGECASGFCSDGLCCEHSCTGSCDRCDLAGSVGLCLLSPSGDLGSPACAGSYTCNGSLPDCPIPCSSGCPADTYCKGAFCAAKRANGTACAQNGECLSDHCVDGVCCDSACPGECEACSVVAGGVVDGTCATLGSARVCRAAASVCDREERCDGVSVDCPANSFQPNTLACQASGYGAWSSCQTSGDTCATSGTQTRSRTDYLCDGAGACASSTASEVQVCVRSSEGLSCGTASYGAWGTCTPDSPNSCTGTQSRTVTHYSCASGSCAPSSSTETQACAIDPGISCGSMQYGSWGSCSGAGSCSGTQSRSVTTYACSGTGSCTPTTTSESQSCVVPEASQCAPTNYGAWGSCTPAVTTDCTGTQSRTVTSYTCVSNTCTATNTVESQGCNRPGGDTCGTSFCDTSDCIRYQPSCNGAGYCDPFGTELWSCGGGCVPN